MKIEKVCKYGECLAKQIKVESVFAAKNSNLDSPKRGISKYLIKKHH
jgi:hypothetical protein